MNLLVQFEVILSSYLFGIIFMIFYDFLNRLLYNKKGKLIRFLIELIFFVLMSILFFIIMLKISNANLNIFIPLFLFLGILTYIFTIQYYFTFAYQKLFEYISLKIKKQKLFLSSKFDIIKMKYRKAKIARYEKNKRSKRNSSSKE